MDLYKSKMMRRIGPGGLKCSCCNPSRGKLKNSHVGKDNSLNKRARRLLKLETQQELLIEILEDTTDNKLDEILDTLKD